MSGKVLSADELLLMSTAELKHKLLQLAQDQDTEPLSKKVLFYKTELQPLFEELSRRNPFPTPKAQLSIISGVWSPVWSTIPFQDSLPGRIHDQSYQIFHDDGYYANIARYAPGHQSSFLQKFSSLLLAYDFMVVQKFAVQNGQWIIQNVGIEQAFRIAGIPLSINRAESWFTAIAAKFKSGQTIDASQAPNLKNFDKSTTKKFAKIFLATPQLEHLYCDPDFRLVKTRREAKQRPSYTIAIRR